MGNKSTKVKDTNESKETKKLQLGETGLAKDGDVDEPDIGESWRPKTALSAAAKRQVEYSVGKLVDKYETISEIPYQDYEYPFENLVFEGGGAKGQVYIGCLQIIDKLDLKIKRYAGASAGAICAALLAAGYTCTELEKILDMDLDTVLIDHSCGICSLLPNLIRHFGWNPGKRFLKVFGALLKAKCGDPDITFKQLYLQKGKELCVTAVNVNMLACEYFHPKTTPNMPIRMAVRMSLSIPGVFEAVKYKNNRGHVDTYIDGGLLCNYPIHAFDGWWLSMNPNDSFLNRLQPLSSMHEKMDKRVRFGEYNHATLGFLVYSSMEQDVMQTELDKRVGVEDVVRPEDSALYKSRADVIKEKKKAMEEHEVFLHSLDRFMKLLNQVNRRASQTLNKINGEAQRNVDDVIDKSELKQAIKEAMARESDCTDTGGDDDISELNKNDLEVLFGVNADIDEVFEHLDNDGSGIISYDELMLFVEKSGIDIQARFQGYDRRELSSVGDFVLGLQDCLLTNVKKMYLDDRDLHRTVGINTDYISTTDFKMQRVDREFCYEQGRKATEAFLKHYVHNPKNAVKKKVPKLAEAVDQLHPTAATNGKVPRSTVSDLTPLSANTASVSRSDQIEERSKLPPIMGLDPNTKTKGAKLPPIRGSVPREGIDETSLSEQTTETEISPVPPRSKVKHSYAGHVNPLTLPDEEEVSEDDSYLGADDRKYGC